jgi:hypothetical protein
MLTDRKTWSCLATALLVLAGWLLAAPLPAQEALSQAPSLRMVPDDAGSYSVMLRGREQLEAVLKSKAWARLNDLPFVKLGWKKLAQEWANPTGGLAGLHTWYKQPGNAELVALASELFEEEVFAYGSKNVADLIVLMQELQQANQFAPLAALFQGGPQAVNQPEMRAKILLHVLADNAERLKVPDIVMGFRLSRTKPAQVVKRLEGLEKLLAGLAPPLKDRLKKVKVQGADVFTLVLDGKLIPWDQIPLPQLEEEQGSLDKLVKRLKAMKLTIGVTVRGNYVLLSIGEGTAGLQAVGEGLPKRLSDRPELAMLAKAAGRRLTAISYLSKDYQKIAAGGDVGDLTGWLKDQLKESGLPADKQARLRKDLKALAAASKRLVPEAGANLSFTYLTARGYEGYDYDWTKNHGLESTKPLTLLQHVGGRPVGFYLARDRVSVADYELMVRWIKLGHQYFEELALPKLPEEVKEVYENFIKDARPLFARLDRATGKMLLPSLDGQGGFVFDASLKSTQWHNAMPPAAKALPLPEPALIVGVRDAALFRKACHEYREVFNGLMAVVAKVSPTPIPEIKIPEPNAKKIKAGTLYSFPLPDQLGLDSRIMPTGGLSDTVAVFTISQEHAKRLLTPLPWKAKGGPLGDAQRPLSSAAYFSWAGTVDLGALWMEYALTLGGQGNDILEQVQGVAEVLKVLRSYTSATYVEEGLVVTHSEIVIRDLER